MKGCCLMATKTPATTPATPAGTSTFEERAAIANAPAWRPEPNDILTGEVLGVRTGKSTEYAEYPVIVYKTADGFRAFHVFHGVARDRMGELKPKKGDKHTIQYLGTRVGNTPIVRNGKEEDNIYHAYYIESGDDQSAGLGEEFAW